MQPLISVVVPIYNVEKYIHKCVNSIINQTYKNLEIILVDDGSPDNCPKICAEYEKKDSRIKVVHKENGGLSDARNAGMKIATGEYISFIDSDDYISKDFIEILYSNLTDENSDIIECDIIRFNENEEPIISNGDFDCKSYDTETSLSMLIAEKEFHQYVWNKLYKRSVIQDIYFEKGKLNEDEFWTYQIFGNAKTISKLDKPMYFYLQRSGSIMGNSYNIRRLDALEAKSNRQKYIDNYFPNLSSQAKIELFGSCIFDCQSTMRFLNGDDKKKAKRIIKMYYNKLSKEELSQIEGNNHFWFSFANKCFFLCCKIRSVIGIGF